MINYDEIISHDKYAILETQIVVYIRNYSLVCS